MANAKIVKAWRDGQAAYLAVRVQETQGAVEYVCSVPLAALAGLTAAEQKAALVAAVKAVRDRQVQAAQDLGLAGTVVL